MMRSYHIEPSILKGSIVIPASKSHTMRAILFAALSKGRSEINHFLSAPDTAHMIHACKLLGAKVICADHQIIVDGIDGKIDVVADVIQAGNSGLILRLLSGIAALSHSYTFITGDHSIRHQRPMHTMLNALNQLGVLAISTHNHGYAPLLIKGPLKGGKVLLHGEDSQPISALLIACALAKEPTEIIVKNPGEKPWVALTLNWLDRLGVKYSNKNFERYFVQGNSKFNSFEYHVPGDWSSAAFPIAAALVTQSSLMIENVDLSDPQGDKEFLHIMKKMGANIEIDTKEKRLHIMPSQLRGITVDINDCIDAITVLATVACFAEGETRIINAAVARQKECDRLHCIYHELSKMGAEITATEDSLIIRGKKIKGARANSHGDHRMAMSLVVAALGASGSSVVENIDCIAKTFPNFVERFMDLGANIESRER